MDISQLECFAAAAELQHMTRAAERLNLSQPAVSKKIGQLEAELDVQLFERIGKKIYLTPAGMVLLQRTNELQGQLVNIVDEVKKIENNSALPTKIVIRALGGVIVDILSAFLRDHPEMRLVVLQDDNASIQKMEYDLMVTFSEEPADGKMSAFLVREPMVLAVSKSNPLAEREEIGLGELRNVPMIQFSKNRMIHARCKRIFEGAGIVPNIRVECDNPASAKALVADNIGVMLIPKYVWKLGGADPIKLLTVDGDKYSRNICISFKKGYYITREARTVFNYVAQAFLRLNAELQL